MEAPDDVKAISERLEVINLQLARAKESRRRALHWFFVALGAIIILAFIALSFWGSPYLGWDFSDLEMAVAGAFLHGFEFVFVRLAPVVFVGAMAGAFAIRRIS